MNWLILYCSVGVFASVFIAFLIRNKERSSAWFAEAAVLTLFMPLWPVFIIYLIIFIVLANGKSER